MKYWLLWEILKMHCCYSRRVCNSSRVTLYDLPWPVKTMSILWYDISWCSQTVSGIHHMLLNQKSSWWLSLINITVDPHMIIKKTRILWNQFRGYMIICEFTIPVPGVLWHSPHVDGYVLPANTKVVFCPTHMTIFIKLPCLKILEVYSIVTLLEWDSVVVLARYIVMVHITVIVANARSFYQTCNVCSDQHTH